MNVAIPSEDEHERESVESLRALLADVLLRVPMCFIFTFFWFAFHVLAFGPNALVTGVNVVLYMTCMLTSGLLISLYSS